MGGFEGNGVEVGGVTGVAALLLRWPGHGGRGGGRGKTEDPRVELGEGKKGSGEPQGLVEAGPAEKQSGYELGCRASPCLAIEAPEQCVGCGGCLVRAGSASGQDAGGSGREWTRALGPFWSQRQCDSGMGYHPSEGCRPAQGGAAHWLSPKEKPGSVQPANSYG